METNDSLSQTDVPEGNTALQIHSCVLPRHWAKNEEQVGSPLRLMTSLTANLLPSEVLFASILATLRRSHPLLMLRDKQDPPVAVLSFLTSLYQSSSESSSRADCHGENAMPEQKKATWGCYQDSCQLTRQKGQLSNSVQRLGSKLQGQWVILMLQM